MALMAGDIDYLPVAIGCTYAGHDEIGEALISLFTLGHHDTKCVVGMGAISP